VTANIIRFLSSCKKLAKATGATIVEAAIAVPLFLLLLFVLIEFIRYFYIYIVLNYAAFRAVDFAAKISIESPIDCIACANGGQKEADCRLYASRVREILRRALHVGRVTGVGPSTRTSGTRFVRFKTYDREGGGDYENCYHSPGERGSGLKERIGKIDVPVKSIEDDAAFLRPGEVAVRMSGPEAGTKYHHPTRQIGDNPYMDLSKTGKGWPQSGENWNGVLAEEPIVVYMEAVFHPLVPVIPDLMIRAQQIGFRHSGGVGRIVPRMTTLTSSTTTTTLTTTTTTIVVTTTTSTVSTTTSTTEVTSTTTSSVSTTTSSTQVTSTSVSSVSTTTSITTSTKSTTTTTSTVSTTTSTTKTTTTTKVTSTVSTTTTSTVTTTTEPCAGCSDYLCSLSHDVWEECNSRSPKCCKDVDDPSGG
jgi:hypothetical protein